MCECGCTSNDIQFWIPAPNKGKYVITLAIPCEDCETPAGVIIELFNRERAKEIELDYVTQLDLKHPAAFPIMYPHRLFKALMRVVCGMFRVKDFYSIPDEIWSKIKPFDPDESRRELFDLFGSSIRAGVKAQLKRDAGDGDTKS